MWDIPPVIKGHLPKTYLAAMIYMIVLTWMPHHKMHIFHEAKTHTHKHAKPMLEGLVGVLIIFWWYWF